MKRLLALVLVCLILCSCSSDKKVCKILVPNTTIEGNVVQSDENTKYQEIGTDGKFKYYDTYWADYRCNMESVNTLGQNTIIYGHSSYKDRPDEDKTFSNLYRYICDENGDTTKGFYFLKENPYIQLEFKDGKAIYQIFAVYYANVDIELKTNTDFSTDAFYFWWVPEHDDPNQDAKERESDLLGLIAGAKKRSEYTIELDVTPEDKFLTLQTCTGRYNGHMYGMPDSNYQNYRFVIMAKLLPDIKEIPKTCDTQMFINPNPYRT